MRKLLFLILIILSISCETDVKSSQDYKDLKKQNETLNEEITILKKTIDSLNNTPDRQYIKAKKLLAENRKEEALRHFTTISENYKGSEYAKKSNDEIKEIEEYFIEEKKKEELKRSLGFKVLKPSSRIELPNLILNFSDIQFNRSFVFDSYGSKYFYRKAERGSKFLTAKVSITSEINNPNLPHILVYRLKDGVLENLTPIGLEYRFRRWEDYGSYLGNTADYSNDFARTKTIRFSLGYEIEEYDFSKFPIYVVLHKKLNIKKEY